jgi:MSHA biogenesis protein MshI
MQQQINLYLKIERKQVQRFSAYTVLLGMGVVAAVLLLVCVGIGISNRTIEQSMAQQQVEKAQLQKTVEELRSNLRQLADVRELDEAITRLGSDVQTKRRIIDKLASMPDKANSGFSGLMSALARAPVNGMWLTAISFAEGGVDVALKGESRTPELVPAYLQQLSNQPVFSGRRFSVLRMQQHTADESAAVPTLAFELHARADEVLQ